MLLENLTKLIISFQIIHLVVLLSFQVQIIMIVRIVKIVRVVRKIYKRIITQSYFLTRIRMKITTSQNISSDTEHFSYYLKLMNLKLINTVKTLPTPLIRIVFLLVVLGLDLVLISGQITRKLSKKKATSKANYSNLLPKLKIILTRTT